MKSKQNNISLNEYICTNENKKQGYEEVMK